MHPLQPTPRPRRHAAPTIRRLLAGVAAALVAMMAAGSAPSASNAAAMSAPPPSAGVAWTSGTMRIGGLDRTWLVAGPARPPSGRLPVIVVLHGRGETPALEASRTGLLGYVAGGKAIVIYPAGLGQSWNAGVCCGAAAAAHVDDAGFIVALLKRTADLPHADPQRIALAGFSNGAKMALTLACGGALHIPGVEVRALAIVAAAAVSACPSGPGVPLVQVAGTHDPLVPYVPSSKPGGGSSLTPVVNEFAAWRADAHCASTSSSAHASGLDVTAWTCPSGPMELATASGAHHEWPPGATATIMDFLTPLLAPASA